MGTRRKTSRVFTLTSVNGQRISYSAATTKQSYSVKYRGRLYTARVSATVEADRSVSATDVDRVIIGVTLNRPLVRGVKIPVRLIFRNRTNTGQPSITRTIILIK
jgi:hypothetical protein